MTGPEPSWEQIVTRVTLAGGAVAVTAAADTWEQTFRRVGDLAANLRDLADRTRHSWDGRSSHAFSTRLDDQAGRLNALVSTYGSLVRALRDCGTHLSAAVAAIPVPSDHVNDVLERRRQYLQTGTLRDIPEGTFRPTTAAPEQAQEWLDEQHRRALRAYQRLRHEYARDLALFPTGAATAPGEHASNEAGTPPPADTTPSTNIATSTGPTAPGSPDRVPAPTVTEPDVGAAPPVPADDHSDRTLPWSGGLAGVAPVPGGSGLPLAGLGPVVSPPALPSGPPSAGGATPIGTMQAATGPAAGMVPAAGPGAGMVPAAGPGAGARGAPAGLAGMYAMPGSGGPTPSGAATGERLPLVDSDGTFLPPSDAPYGVLNNP